jgi:hypothetical protein
MAERSDIELMEDLLTREGRLISAYEGALRRDAIDRGLGEMLLAHERAHARALEQSLSRAGDRNPRATVPSPELTAGLRDRKSFAQYAIQLEDETVGIYADSIPRIRDASLRQPLGSIMACGAAHVAELRQSLGSLYLTN